MTPPTGPGSPPGTPPGSPPGGGTPPAGMTEEEIKRYTKLYGDLTDAIKTLASATEDLEDEYRSAETTLARKQEIEIKLLEIEKDRTTAAIKLTDAAVNLGRTEADSYTKALDKARVTRDQVTAENALTEAIKKHREETKKLLKEQEQLTNGIKQGEDAWDSLAKSIGVVDNKYSQFFEALQSKKGVAGFFDGLKSGFSKSFSTAKVAAFFVETIVSANVELFKNMDKAQANFKKNFTGQFADSIIEETNKFEKGLRTMGVSYEESLGARTEIASSYSLYEEASDEMRNSLAKDAALMAKSGITNNQYTESIDSMVMSLGMSEESAMQNIRKFTVLSSVLRKSKTQIMTDFKSMSNYLSQFGSQSIKVFTDLEAVSTKTGLSMEKITAVTEKFSTFGGAADAVGRLNAILGPSGLLNPLEVFQEMDPAKQFMMLFDAIKRAGIDMNKPQNRFIFKELGNITGLQTEDIKRVLTALNKGKGSLEEIRQAIENTGEVSDKALQDQARATRTLGEKAVDYKASTAAGAGTLQGGLDVAHGAANVGLDVQQQSPHSFSNMAAFASGMAGMRNLSVGRTLLAHSGDIAARSSFFFRTPSVLEALTEAFSSGRAALRVGGLRGFFSAFRSAPGMRTLASMGASNPASRLMPGVGAALNFYAAIDEASTTGFSTRVLGNLLAGGAGLASMFPPLTPIFGPISMALNAAMLAADAFNYMRGGSSQQAASAADQASSGGGTPTETVESAMDTDLVQGADTGGVGFATGGIITKEITNASLGERNRTEAVIPLQDGSNHLAQPLYMALEKFATSNKGSGANVVPNINLTVVLDGNELKSYVKNVIGETLNPFT